MPSARIPPVVLLLLLGVSCAREAPAVPRASQGPGVESRNAAGMVVSGSPFATEAGIRVLEEGGNAVDAAVATAFALAVVEPTMSGLGGRTQLVLRTAGGEVAAIDGTTEVPVAYNGGPVDNESAYGYSTIAVPGTVAALATALREHGTWPLERVLQSAIDLADAGFDLPAAEADRIAATAGRLREFDASRQYFLKPDGSTYAAGETLRQPDLANTLRAIATGGEDAFYRGDIAHRMAADLQAHGALVTEADLSAYKAEHSIVVRGRYRGYELIGSYLPASGATTIEILQILDRADLAATVGTSTWIANVSRALLAGFEDREADVSPADRKAAWLVSPELADERARELGVAATGPVGEALALPTATSTREPEFTTHLSVADRDGGIVALTQSVGPLMGSRVAAPGLGFLYAATMEYLGDLEPDTRRHWSSQSPLLILRNGQPAWIIGGAGARRILSAIVETTSRLIDQRLPLAEALAAPRFHPAPSRIDAEVRPGTAWSDTALARLMEQGFTVRERDDAPWFARINAIARDSVTGEWVGVAEPRWQGSAGGPRR